MTSLSWQEIETGVAPRSRPAGRMSGPNLPIYVVILKGIHEQIRFADAKAAFLTALNVALFGFLALKVDGILVASANGGGGLKFALAVALQLLYLTATAGAIATVVLAVMPRFGEMAPQNKLFFRRIVREYGKDWPRYVRDLNSLSDDDWFDFPRRNLSLPSRGGIALSTTAEPPVTPPAAFLFWGSMHGVDRPDRSRRLRRCRGRCTSLYRRRDAREHLLVRDRAFQLRVHLSATAVRGGHLRAPYPPTMCS